MKRQLFSTLIIIAVWWLISMIVNKPILLPPPNAVMAKMAGLITSSRFHLALIATLGRVFFAFLIALVIGSLLALLSGYSFQVRQYLEPVIKIFQTVPQASYILIIIVWFNSTTSLMLIILMMTVPIFYYAILNGYLAIESDYFDVAKLYGVNEISNVVLVTIPLLKSSFLSAINAALPLSIKIAVMAEIFISSATGIGSQLYLARINLDMATIFALTIYMIIIIAIPSNLINRISLKK